MFDLGFGELLMLGLVALVVLGPERLPKAARFAGLWARRARAQWYSVKSEFEREMAADELKQSLDAARTAATDFEKEARSAVSDLDRSVREKGEAARGELQALRDDLSAGVEPGASADAEPTGDARKPASDDNAPATTGSRPADPATAAAPSPPEGGRDGER